MDGRGRDTEEIKPSGGEHRQTHLGGEGQELAVIPERGTQRGLSWLPARLSPDRSQKVSEVENRHRLTKTTQT